jgi:hypothetical protein
MRSALFLFFISCSLSLAAQDSVRKRWLKFEMMPLNYHLSLFRVPDMDPLPASAQCFYIPEKSYATGMRSFNIRTVIADRFLFGVGLTASSIKVDRDAILAKVSADHPEYFTEMTELSNEFNNFGSVIFAGAAFRLNPQWRLETLLDFRMNDLQVFGGSFAFKDKQSNAFFTRTYSSQIEKARSLGFQCNVLRYGKKYPNLFFGVQLTAGTDLYKGKGLVTDHSFSVTTEVAAYDVSRRFNFITVGPVFGLRFYKGAFQ